LRTSRRVNSSEICTACHRHTNSWQFWKFIIPNKHERQVPLLVIFKVSKPRDKKYGDIPETNLNLSQGVFENYGGIAIPSYIEAYVMKNVCIPHFNRLVGSFLWEFSSITAENSLLITKERKDETSTSAHGLKKTKRKLMLFRKMTKESKLFFSHTSSTLRKWRRNGRDKSCFKNEKTSHH